MSATGKAAQIADALLAWAALMATEGPTLPVAMPGVNFDPPVGPYLEVAHFPAPPQWEGVRDGVVDTGRLVVGVVWPKMSPGVIKPLEAAEKVRAHFAKGLRLISGSTTVKINREPFVGAPIQLPDRQIVSVTILWTA